MSYPDQFADPSATELLNILEKHSQQTAAATALELQRRLLSFPDVTMLTQLRREPISREMFAKSILHVLQEPSDSKIRDFIDTALDDQIPEDAELIPTKTLCEYGALVLRCFQLKGASADDSLENLIDLIPAFEKAPMRRDLVKQLVHISSALMIDMLPAFRDDLISVPFMSNYLVSPEVKQLFAECLKAKQLAGTLKNLVAEQKLMSVPQFFRWLQTPDTLSILQTVMLRKPLATQKAFLDDLFDLGTPKQLFRFFTAAFRQMVDLEVLRYVENQLQQSVIRHSEPVDLEKDATPTEDAWLLRNALLPTTKITRVQNASKETMQWMLQYLYKLANVGVEATIFQIPIGNRDHRNLLASRAEDSTCSYDTLSDYIFWFFQLLENAALPKDAALELKVSEVVASLYDSPFADDLHYAPIQADLLSYLCVQNDFYQSTTALMSRVQSSLIDDTARTDFCARASKAVSASVLKQLTAIHESDAASETLLDFLKATLSIFPENEKLFSPEATLFGLKVLPTTDESLAHIISRANVLELLLAQEFFHTYPQNVIPKLLETARVSYDHFDPELLSLEAAIQRRDTLAISWITRYSANMPKITEILETNTEKLLQSRDLETLDWLLHSVYALADLQPSHTDLLEFLKQQKEFEMLANCLKLFGRNSHGFCSRHALNMSQLLKTPTKSLEKKLQTIFDQPTDLLQPTSIQDIQRLQEAQRGSTRGPEPRKEQSV